jgi:CPA2 family monovalent cation:H+ antiporter-2
VLSGLFFISLGMLIDLPAVLAHLPLILGVAAAIILGKAIAASGALVVSLSPLRVAIVTGIGLAQVGEFSFILGRAGLDAGLLPSSTWQTMFGASVATMVATPTLLAIAPSVASFFRPRERAHHVARTGIPALSGHVIVLGFGVGGQLVARALRDLGVPYIILELNGATVRRAKAEGERIFYGDATSPESLHAARLEEAVAVVCLLSDPDAAERMVKTARQISPTVPIVVRTRYRVEAERLQSHGATVAVAEELEASLEVVAQMLARLHVAGNVIETLLDVFRRESVSLRPVRAPRPMLQSLPEAIQRMPVATHRVEGAQWGVGKSIAELNLRAHSGASILAVQRGERYLTALSPDERIEAGDVLYLVGDESDVMLARQRLMEG